jgi:hypothetical protein
MRSLSKKELKELLNKCWMTHDGMWFYHCMEMCGIEMANRINKAAVKSMAMIEVKRIKKALRIEDIRKFDDLKELIEGAMGLMKADFMEFVASFPSKDVFRWEMVGCFAYEGIKRLGVIDQYDCGIFDRVDGWFDGLGLHYSATPQFEGCLMHKDGKCAREYTFVFQEET